MRATIHNLREWVTNPGPDANQIINGKTPHDRGKHLLSQAEQRIRSKQIALYDTKRGEDESTVKVSCEVLDELNDWTEDMRKGLRRGTADPEDVMRKVAESMRQLRDFAVEAEAVGANAIAAAEMVDKDPADFEQEQIVDRFPSLRGAVLTPAYLRGEEPSPFADGEG